MEGRWDPLFRVLRAIDSEIEQLYERRGKAQMRSRFALPLLRLAHGGPVSIKELAAGMGHTHSAVSQTVDAMRRAGLVETRPGSDARIREVHLTDEGRALAPTVEREWLATEAAVAELDDSLSASLVTLAAELEEALASRGIRERLEAHFSKSILRPDQ